MSARCPQSQRGKKHAARITLKTRGFQLPSSGQGHREAGMVLLGTKVTTEGFTKGLYVTNLSYALRPCHCPAAISVFLCVYLWTYTVSYMSQLLSFPHSPPENLIPSKYPFSIIHREAKNTKPPPSLIRKQGNRKQRMWVSPAHCPTKMVPYYMPEGCQGDCCSFCLAEQVSHH